MIRKYELELWLSISISVFAQICYSESEIVKVNSGYIFNLDAPSGETRFVSFESSSIFSEAEITFSIERRYESTEWPTGLNIQFENNEYKYIAIASLQNSHKAGNFVLEAGFWVGGDKYPERVSSPTPHSKAEEMTVRIKVRGTEEIDYFINDINYQEIPFPIKLDKTTIGFQSAKGQINVKLLP